VVFRSAPSGAKNFARTPLIDEKDLRSVAVAVTASAAGIQAAAGVPGKVTVRMHSG
jgi:hypothetical protein